MQVTLVHVRVKPESVPAFIEATRLNHEASVQEPGNRRFDVLQDPADPSRFCLYEAYASEAVTHSPSAAARNAPWFLLLLIVVVLLSIVSPMAYLVSAGGAAAGR